MFKSVTYPPVSTQVSEFTAAFRHGRYGPHLLWTLTFPLTVT